MEEDILDDSLIVNDELEEFDEEVEAGDDIQQTSDNGLYEHFRFSVDKGQKMIRIDKYIVNHLVGISRNRVQNAADAGFIFVNDVSVKANYKVKPNDEIVIMMNRPKYDNALIPEDIPLNIVYEDADVLVVNKQPGLVVHPGFGNYSGTLVNALAFHFKDNPDFNPEDPRMGLVHRIDKDTSGLLVIAKNENAKTHLGLQFFNKTTKRQYCAVVWGNVEQDSGTIEGNIGRSVKDRLQLTVFPEGDQGKHAVTHYKVRERLGYVSVVECVLETGRTHQIRVHMKYIGHTLFNDSRYGGDSILKGTTFTKYKQFVQNNFEICPRQALHAQTLGFVHPRTGEEMFFEAPIPQDMTNLMDRWRNYISNREI